MEDDIFRVSKGTVMTPELLSEYITKHKKMVRDRFKPLLDAYKNDYAIQHQTRKAAYKPDNRIPVNFAKYIADTMNGFFVGIPIKTAHDTAAVSAFLEQFEQYNGVDDVNAELSKICCIFGRGYEMYYVDDFEKLCVRYLSPMNAFMIYDDSILEEPLFFVHYYKDADGVEKGSFSDGRVVRWFTNRAVMSFPKRKKSTPLTAFRQRNTLRTRSAWVFLRACCP